jgi:predicted acylesterase/phospholipase RssA
MTIKHFVFSGGGPSMIQTLGALEHLETTKFIDLNAIETIYGTSAGAIVGALLCFKYDWPTLNDYILKRPWLDVFPIKVQTIFDAYAKKGVFDIKTIEKCFKPLMDAKDIPLNTTLKDFYEYSKIELHLFAFEINDFQLADISYLTHPALPLLTAMQMTCGIPMLVMPVCIDDKCYIDGGIMCNYPLQFCLESGKKEDEVLGFKNQYDATNESHVHSESTIIDFIMCFLFKIIHNLSITHKQPSIKYEVICATRLISISFFKSSLSTYEARLELFNSGVEHAKKFLTEQLGEIELESLC